MLFVKVAALIALYEAGAFIVTISGPLKSWDAIRGLQVLSLVGVLGALGWMII
jgi:hypothetical protein